jgi:sulfur-oxidizing protein SoxY
MLRRGTLRYITSGSIMLFSGLLNPLTVFAKWNKAAFSAVDFDEAVAAYFPEQKIQSTEQITIGVHPIVENGAVVPVKIKTDMQNVESITIFVDKNPNPLIANFDLSPDCIGFVSTRIKIQQPSNIVAIVKSDKGVFSKSTFIEVHEGGCG